jgi:hypothetical protein
MGGIFGHAAPQIFQPLFINSLISCFHDKRSQNERLFFFAAPRLHAHNADLSTLAVFWIYSTYFIKY